ncbi:MAG: hypothetical protein O8C61_02480 [Candidatus Methanoperedens sp.]|nr:hypothetical protein [Candidatus Methanoperedens sp.]
MTENCNYPVPDISNVQKKPADILFHDQIPKMKARVCMNCSGKVEGFDTEFAQKEFLISGMCQICQNQAFCADDEGCQVSPKPRLTCSFFPFFSCPVFPLSMILS